MATQDTTVGVQPYTGSGSQKIRNLQLTVVDQTTNTFSTVLMQVVSIADARGNILNDLQNSDWQQAVLRELQAIRKGIGLISGDPFLAEGD